MNRSIVCFTTLLLVASVLGAGTTYTVETTNPAGDVTGTGELTIEGLNLRMSTTEAGDTTMIYRGADDEMIVVDHGERSYMVLDKETVEALAAKLGDVSKQLEAALANVPPEQRAMVEQMMKDRMGAAVSSFEPPPPAEVTDLGRGDTIEGIECGWREISREGVVELETCVCDWDDVEGGGQLRETFMDMKEFVQSMMETLATAGGPLGGLMSNIEQSFAGEMILGDGFPLQTNDFEDGAVAQTTKFLGATEAATDDTTFVPPAAYARQDPLGGMQ